MSLLNYAVGAPAWTTILINAAKPTEPRRWKGYSPQRYLDSWAQLMFLEQYPRGSLLLEWDGRQWRQPPYLSERVTGAGPFGPYRYDVDLDTWTPARGPYPGFRTVHQTNSLQIAKAIGWSLARAIPDSAVQIWDWGTGPRKFGSRPSLAAAYAH